MARETIVWGPKFRPRKTDQGHTAVQFGQVKDSWGALRVRYTRCQCGSVHRGRGGDGSDYYAHRKHQKREAEKRARTEAQL